MYEPVLSQGVQTFGQNHHVKSTGEPEKCELSQSN